MDNTANELDDDFSLARPTRTERAHDDRVDFLLDQLERAGRGEQTVWCLSNVLDSLRHRQASVLSPRHRDELLRATAIAHLAARRVFPENLQPRTDRRRHGSPRRADRVLV